MKIEGSRTYDNLKLAFAGESQTVQRYLFFAKQADQCEKPEIAALFRKVAQGEALHVNAVLDFLKLAGDPATGMPISGLTESLRAAVAGETRAYNNVYPNMAAVARAEGFSAIAELFESMAADEKSHADSFSRALER